MSAICYTSAGSIFVRHWKDMNQQAAVHHRDPFSDPAPFPGARIYTFDTAPVRAVPSWDLDHVRLTRDFLNAPERYLNQIFDRKAPSRQREGARE